MMVNPSTLLKIVLADNTVVKITDRTSKIYHKCFWLGQGEGRTVGFPAPLSPVSAFDPLTVLEVPLTCRKRNLCCLLPSRAFLQLGRAMSISISPHLH